jgi:hypothetical protein
LTVARLGFLTFGAMHESGAFSVETMQTIGLLIDKGIILRNKLPSNFRRNDVAVNGRRRCRSSHDDDEKYERCKTRLASKFFCGEMIK